MSKVQLLESMLPILTQPGIVVDAVDEYGHSHLHRAVAVKNINFVQTLLTHGARIDLPDKKGVTPLDIALGLAQSGEKLVELLLQAHKPVTTSTTKFSEYARLLQATIQWGLRGAEQEMLRQSVAETKESKSSKAAEISRLRRCVGLCLSEHGKRRQLLLSHHQPSIAAAIRD